MYNFSPNPIRSRYDYNCFLQSLAVQTYFYFCTPLPLCLPPTPFLADSIVNMQSGERSLCKVWFENTYSVLVYQGFLKQCPQFRSSDCQGNILYRFLASFFLLLQFLPPLANSFLKLAHAPQHFFFPAYSFFSGHSSFPHGQLISLLFLSLLIHTVASLFLQFAPISC